jgi:hypothetical protein
MKGDKALELGFDPNNLLRCALAYRQRVARSNPFGSYMALCFGSFWRRLESEQRLFEFASLARGICVGREIKEFVAKWG